MISRDLKFPVWITPRISRIYCKCGRWSETLDPGSGLPYVERLPRCPFWRWWNFWSHQTLTELK